MSKIYENENQMIIRFPKEIADKIRDGFEKNQKLNINIQPRLDDGLQFDIDIPDLKYKDNGQLVELPTITESYKTRDYINLFKSNDINQMIWVGKQKNCRKIEDKIICDSGLTPPTYDIRKDFHRKQPDINLEDIQRVESELDQIQKEFMTQQEEEYSQEDNNEYQDGIKRRRKKKYNKF